jgi:hypothetical protein
MGSSAIYLRRIQMESPSLPGLLVALASKAEWLAALGSLAPIRTAKLDLAAHASATTHGSIRANPSRHKNI